MIVNMGLKLRREMTELNIVQSVEQPLTMPVLDKGFVILDEMMGGDQKTVRAARVSNGKLEPEYDLAKQAKLINYLAKHRHGSPFEHSYFSFIIKCPLFVAREWQRHRIGSFNEISGRYVVFEPEFYIPDQIRVPAETNKQGSTLPTQEFINQWAKDTFGILNYSELDNPISFNSYTKRIIEYANNTSFNSYKELIASGVAKEIARMVLPLSLYTSYFWTVNARSLSNFCSLRSAEDAQWEIRQYSQTIESIWAQKMPLVYDAWNNNGRVSL